MRLHEKTVNSHFVEPNSRHSHLIVLPKHHPGKSGLDGRLLAWSKNQDLEAVHASIDFGEVLHVEDVITLSKTYNFKPYTAYMFLDDQNGVDRVPPEEAGVDFIQIALANALALKRTTLKSFEPRMKGFQRAIEEIGDPVNEAQQQKIAFFKRQSAAIAEREISERIALNKLLNDPHFIYGIDIIAPEKSIRELSEIYKVEVGVFVNGRIVVPQPPSRDIIK